MVDWLTMVYIWQTGKVSKTIIEEYCAYLYREGSPFQKGECKNDRGISLLSIVYLAKFMDVDRKSERNLKGIWERNSMNLEKEGCVDQIFILKQLNEKYASKERSIKVVSMDLGKMYGGVHWDCMWRVLEIYSVSANLLNGIENSI